MDEIEIPENFLTDMPILNDNTGRRQTTTTPHIINIF